MVYNLRIFNEYHIVHIRLSCCICLLGKPMMAIAIEVQHRLMVNYLFTS